MERMLDDIDFNSREKKTYRKADKGKRFANYIIDVIGYLIFSAIIGVVLAIGTDLSGNDEVFEEENLFNSQLLEWLMGLIIITIYYTLQEYLFKGKTLGKFITKTRAVTESNERMSFEVTLIRSLCRLIPFEGFSYLGDGLDGWHDSFSKTQVIEDIDWSDNELI